jgi:hypothetical protein
MIKLAGWAIGCKFCVEKSGDVGPAWIMSFGAKQTSNLPKVFTPFESKTNSGQFVLLSPNGSIDLSATCE